MSYYPKYCVHVKALVVNNCGVVLNHAPPWLVLLIFGS